MAKVQFFDLSDMPDKPIEFAVIAARHRGKWIFCRHKNRLTWEIPGGHLEPGETPMDAARRELWEETGADEARIAPICGYGYGKLGILFLAEVHTVGEIPEFSEIEEVKFFDELPEKLTYPQIQPYLFHRIIEFAGENYGL